MARPEKSYVSPEYAARQARFAALGPAVLLKPLSFVRARFKVCLELYVRHRGVRPLPYPSELAKDLRRTRLAADRGDGTEVKAAGWYYLA